MVTVGVSVGVCDGAGVAVLVAVGKSEGEGIGVKGWVGEGGMGVEEGGSIPRLSVRVASGATAGVQPAQPAASNRAMSHSIPGFIMPNTIYKFLGPGYILTIRICKYFL
jgi:hypothetical protein